MSKELQALENIKHYDNRVGLHEDDYEVIENALKTLELIKTKGIDLYNLRRTEDVEDYNRFRHYYYDELTEEEYKLFKDFFVK